MKSGLSVPLGCAKERHPPHLGNYDQPSLVVRPTPDTLLPRKSLAPACRDAVRTTEAVALFGRMLADRERPLGAEHPDTKLVRDNLADLTS